MGQIDTIDLHWPLGGLNRRMGYQNALGGVYTTPDCLNVRSEDVFQQRLRGGSRPGLVQVLPPKSVESGEEPENPILGPFVYEPEKDCHANEDTGANVNGNNCLVGLLAGRISRSFLHFDLTAGATPVPAGATIESATLALRGFNSIATSWTAYIRKLLRTGWTETGCNWSQYDGTNSWTTAGGSGVGTDIATTSPDQVEFTVAGGLSTVWMTITGLEELIQDAVTNASRQVHVQLLKVDEATNGRWFFNSSEGGAPSDTEPKLTLTYREA